MKILLASPFYSQHWDAGHFWARAFSRLGHELVLWDYRTDISPPDGVSCDLAVVMKGDRRTLVPRHVAPIRVCYWPDDFERGPDDGDGQPAANFPKAQELLYNYDIVFSPIFPTPAEGMVWLPGAWDERVHVRRVLTRQHMRGGSVFAGTYTERKAKFLKVMKPGLIVGNGWHSTLSRAVYLHEYVGMLSQYSLSINVHRDDIGINRRLFEMMACGFTITDRVPGVVELLGEWLAEKVTFETPAEGLELKDYYLRAIDQSSGGYGRDIQILWEMERDAIANYTYTHLARSIIDAVEHLH